MNAKTNAKKKTILERIRHFEDAIIKGREYLETGKHANLPRFRPWFYGNFKDGRELPPHKDWVKNVFLPRLERAVRQAEKALEKLS